ncbi:protein NONRESPONDING TO OXYLIPINS 2, mitochondrial isoform X2 [Malania oleifera]|uniref:protein NONRESPONDING TO OXYLIPINS 2, mitochondrial isoform X2 n=1 Tax=Malania oleifera TaxID=397392 RepID=UPI0025ADCA90|nr:protein NONRESPONDING TO OXYLIPINS 2, mitochondrial isoform X2 [Malania oleifera]
MASFCRAALLSRARSVTSRSRTLLPNSTSAKPTPSLLSSSPVPTPCASRVLSALGSVESLMPLHSAIASARLKSSIAADSSCWSWLSQDFAVPR